MNIFGLIIIAIMMLPNIVYALIHKEGFRNKWQNKPVEFIEQIGRIGCLVFMIFNVPGTCFGWWSDEAFTIYLIGNAVLLLVYLAFWVICFNKMNRVFSALALSITPSVLFIFSGIMSRSLLLLLVAFIFAPCHILISYKNVKLN